MSNLPKVDVTDYVYQKFCYCIILDEEIMIKLDQFFGILQKPRFWGIFVQELSFLLSRHCLLEEINRIYNVLSVARSLELDAVSSQIINECIKRLNIYKVDMNRKYYDGFYITEMKKRFPYERFKSERIEQYIPSIKESLGMDFYILSSLIEEDEELFKEILLPSFAIDIPIISNIRAFAYEMPELFTTEIFCHRLELLIQKWEEDLKAYNLLGRIRGKQLIKRYKEYLR